MLNRGVAKRSVSFNQSPPRCFLVHLQTSRKHGRCAWILIAIIEPLDVQGLKVSKFHVGNHIPFIKVKSSSW